MTRLRALLIAASVLLSSPVGAQGRVTAAFVGDVMLAETEDTGKSIARGGDPFVNVSPLLRLADLRIANFESSAGTRGQPDSLKPYSFRTAHSALATFASVFDVAGLANNHTGDFGREDLLETGEALAKAGVHTFGSGKTPADAHHALMLKRNGVRIALLGYLDFFPRWFAVAPGLPGVAWLDDDQAVLDIARARTAGADVVIVVPHWGIEHQPLANPRQRRLARLLIDAGADAVIGGHPHVVQDYEVYRGKPIVYSLGNFVFDGFDDEDNRTGWILFAEIGRQGVMGISTRVVRLDPGGSPIPDLSQTGPCWQKGESRMRACGGAPRSPSD